MSDLAIGIVGLGRMGTYHLETWEHVEGAQVVAVAEPNADLATERIGRRPIARFEHHRELVTRSDVDAICITAPSAQHANIALDAIAAGKHVLVEKPIATTLEDGLRMAAAARGAGVKLMVGHVERFNPAVGKLAALIAEGRIGRVFRAHATRVGPMPLRIQDAGVAIDLATHDLDIMQFVLGRDISRVYAEGAQLSHPTQEDMIACLLRFGDDGPFGLLDVNWLTPEKRREISVIGEDGMLTASYLTQDVWFTESPTKQTAGTSWRGSAATPRARPCASPCAASSRSRPSSRPSPPACATTPPSRSPPTTAAARSSRPSRCATRPSTPVP